MMKMMRMMMMMTMMTMMMKTPKIQILVRVFQLSALCQDLITNRKLRKVNASEFNLYIEKVENPF